MMATLTKELEFRPAKKEGCKAGVVGWCCCCCSFAGKAGVPFPLTPPPSNNMRTESCFDGLLTNGCARLRLHSYTHRLRRYALRPRMVFFFFFLVVRYAFSGTGLP